MLPKRKKRPPIPSDPWDCPRCGCNETTELQSDSIDIVRARCEECHHEFWVKESTDDRVGYIQKIIPVCPTHHQQMISNGSKTDRAIVYYRCKIPGCNRTKKGSTRHII